MILVMVGTQLPFDRLIRTIDAIAPTLSADVFAQTGNGAYVPKDIKWKGLIGPAEFDDLLPRTSVIVAHAGVGTILMAQKHRKPIILFPRRSAMGEHRNDHQAATASAMEGRSGIYIARTSDELARLLGRRLEPPQDDVTTSLDRERLNNAVADYIRKNAARHSDRRAIFSFRK